LKFEFSTATRIVFGSGRIREAISAASSLGRSALIVTGGTPARVDALIQELQAQKVECIPFSIKGEPTISDILSGVHAAKESGCEIVIGIGGGSALDGAKAIAALLTNPGDPLDYLEVVGSGRLLTKPCAPCICIPTTAGTGCEVTRNSVLVSPEHRVKVSLRSPRMLPTLAVIDPDLTHSLSRSVTASTGMDALTQLIEPFVSNFSNPMTDAFCRDGIQRVSSSLRAACDNGRNAKAREDMALASLFGGLALANAGLGAVHGLAAPLGGSLAVPHGVVCARLLPIVMDTNLKALSARSGGPEVLSRYDEIARLLTGTSFARARDGVAWIRSLGEELSIPPLSCFGIASGDLPSIATNAKRASSMKGNPIELTLEELTAILNEAL
jgi:alcohol dehydrogenase class IV